MELGKSLSYQTVTTGLRDLCPDLHFDLAGNIGHWHPKIEQFAGVFYSGRHLCSMDREILPEFKIWSVIKAPVEIDPSTVGVIDGAWIHWETVSPWDSRYPRGLELAPKFLDGWALEGAKLRHYRGFVMGKSRGPIIKLGWRHTFEAILRSRIPGVTRESLSRKFTVDMSLFPMGAPEEVALALFAE